MTVCEYIADFLEKKGVKDIFCVDGSAAAGIIVAVAKNKRLRYYCPLHEQSGSFAVDGYFKASRKVSAMIATSGPGGQNLINGIAASYYDSCPAIYITGQVNSRFLKPNDKIRQLGFQENDIVSMVKPVTKYAVMLKDIEQVSYEFEKAFYLATTGRPGPVLIDVPMDIQKMTMPTTLKRHNPPHQPEFNHDKELSICFDMLVKAKRPAILLGGGVWLADAVKDCRKLADKLKTVPVFVTWNMIDYVDPEHYGGKIGTFGGDGRNFGIQNCDFLLSIGSRISGRITGGILNAFARAAKKVIVDIDGEELKYQQAKGDLNICCDAKVFVNKFLNIIDKKNIPDYSWWLDKVKSWRLSYPVVRDEYRKTKNYINPYVFVKVLSGFMKKGDVLVHEAGGNCVVTSQAFEAKLNQRVFSNNGNSSLGYALPAAIGACIATNKKVISIMGDGGINFNIQELQMLKSYNLPVKVLIFNNRSFGITKLYRDTNFNSEYAGVDGKHGLIFPDLIKISKAYGIKAVKIKNYCDLNNKINYVLDSNEPVVCDVNMAGYYDYQPRLGWRSPIEDQYPFLDRKEFLENMIIEPISGWENPVYP
ncbi:MAG: thiamine pyrophosphate-binding protein [Planctomycetes bacterium]|nr:thiamine pyrophosphate-binding protein [Planctomycetota bacterium]MBU1517380.1 thiamine pyrophosphate-binding protein [Planctomycetota bacterium]MBU2596807.1 thiamine pyrophosphate-binding protein [Planctomycetota bacterium]